MTTLITAPDTVAQDAIMAALSALAPYGPAAWSVFPATEQIVARLLADPDDPAHVRRAWVAQRQDGGVLSAYARMAGWRGLFVVRCLSASDALARDGRARADTAMAGLAASGHYIKAKRTAFTPSYAAPDEAGVYTRAYQYEVVVR